MRFISAEKIKKIAAHTIETESIALKKLIQYIDDDFVQSVKLIHKSTGRVVITGIGKSANIANKIVATLNSTGTPSLFMHAADAIHGDLGYIQPHDIVICLSKSGKTEEIKTLLPLIRNMGNKIIAITGNTDSELAKHADLVLNTTVDKEACPNNLAPTSSTTAQLAMGDALAVCLLECRHFSKEDFAAFHPGGTLGKKLLLKVRDIYPRNEKPCVSPNDKIKQVIIEISAKRLGATAVVENETLVGIITDGDLRRMLEKYKHFETIAAKDIMSRKPKTVHPETRAEKALQMMKQHNITQLLVTENEQYAGMIHMHDIIKEGII